MTKFTMAGGFDRLDRGQCHLEQMEPPQPIEQAKPRSVLTVGREKWNVLKERLGELIKERRDDHVDAWAKEAMSVPDYVSFRQAVREGCYTHAYDVIELYNAWPWQRIRFSLWMSSHS